MEAMYLLLPLSLVLVTIVIVVLLWAASSGQFDDLQGPAERVLLDDDDVPSDPNGLSRSEAQPKSERDSGGAIDQQRRKIGTKG